MSLRIAVADDDAHTRQFLHEALTSLGHTIVCAAQNGTQLLDGCRKEKPDIVITDIKMPDMDGLDAASAIWQEFSIPVILLSGYTEEQLIERASGNHVMAFLVKPIKTRDLAPAIVVAMQRFSEFQTLRNEATDLRQAIVERKLIERAKGITMKRAGLDEAAAFERLQEMARNTNRKLAQVSEMIITADTAFKAGDAKEKA